MLFRHPFSPRISLIPLLRFALAGVVALAAAGETGAISEVPESFARVSVRATTGSTSTLTDLKTIADADPPSSSVTNAASDATTSASGMAEATAPPTGSLTGTLKSLAHASATEVAAFTSTFAESNARYIAAYQVMGPGGPGTPVPLDLDIMLDGFLDVDTPGGLQQDNPRTASAEVVLNVDVFASYADFVCSLTGCAFEGATLFSGSTQILRSSRTSSNRGLVQTNSFVGTGTYVATTGNDRWDVVIDESIAAGFDPLVGDEIIVRAALTTRATFLNYMGAELESTANFFDTFSFLPTSSDPGVSFEFVAIPEPGAAALAALGLLGVLRSRRRA